MNDVAHELIHAFDCLNYKYCDKVSCADYYWCLSDQASHPAVATESFEPKGLAVARHGCPCTGRFSKLFGLAKRLQIAISGWLEL